MKKILVTGGSGFIGTNFIRFVLEKFPEWQICNLDALTYAGNFANNKDHEHDPGYSFVHGSINDAVLLKTLFSEHEFDAVFHFAAESHVDRSIHDPFVFIDTNICGTFRLLEASLEYYQTSGKKDFRFIHVSTDEVYGTLGFNDPGFKETTPYDPSSPYSASKASSDHFAGAYFKTYGLPVIITNCSNNYGPWQFPEKLIPLTVLNIINQRPLPVYGAGENVRDWLYVVDHCDALMHACLKGRPGQTYNIGGGEEKKNIETVEAICSIMDEKLSHENLNRGSSKRLIKFVQDRKGHDLRYAINPEKTRTQLGWSAGHSFENALSSTIDWYLNNMEWVRSIQTKKYLKWIEKQYSSEEKKGEI